MYVRLNLNITIKLYLKLNDLELFTSKDAGNILWIQKSDQSGPSYLEITEDGSLAWPDSPTLDLSRNGHVICHNGILIRINNNNY